MKRTIIITGGTTGIGKATAYQFAKNGWNVVITSRSEKKGNAFVEEAKNEGLDMTFFQLDVTNEKQVAKVIEQTGGGTIVNLASIAGLNGLIYTAQYCATKHAVVGLTKAAAIDYAQQGIRINAVAPGAIKTDILKHAIDASAYDEKGIAAIHPMNRMGEVQDIALAIYYLASPDNKFLTGTILNVDGGYNCK